MKSGGFMYRKKNIKEPKIFKFAFMPAQKLSDTDKIESFIDEKISEATKFFNGEISISHTKINVDDVVDARLIVNRVAAKETLSTIIFLHDYIISCADEDAPIIVLDNDELHTFSNFENFLKVYEEVSKESESLEDVLKNRNTSDSIILHDDSFWLSEHNSDIYLESLVAKYVLRPDNMSNEDDFQTLTIENVNGGSGDYFRIKTGSDDPKDNIKFVSLSDANELSSILKDFEKRLNMFSKVKIS